MRQVVTVGVLTLLAACGATPHEYRNEKELPLPPGEGMFGSALTWELHRKQPAPAEPLPSPPPSPSSDERQEFEEWRSWQEWKRRHP
jgi:hypothetical protein